MEVSGWRVFRCSLVDYLPVECDFVSLLLEVPVPLVVDTLLVLAASTRSSGSCSPSFLNISVGVFFCYRSSPSM